MPRYRVYGKVVGSKYMGEYEATSKKEAEGMAVEAEGRCRLCHQCSDECEYPEIEDVTVEEVEEPKPARKKKK